MTPARRLTSGSVGGLALLVLAACTAGEQAGNNSVADDVVTTDASGGQAAVPTIETVSESGNTLAAALAGATPMRERIAVLGLLNKRNGETREIRMKPGQAIRYGDVIVRLRACERTAPWEQDQYTGAFVQLDVQQPDQKWQRVFSGWLFKERPALNVVLHPIYDVWPKSCEMTYPESGPETVAAGNVGGSGSGGDSAKPRSSAKKSPSTEGAPEASPAEDSPKADDSNER